MLAQLYPWFLALHIISFIAWMAGMLYLPRLFVYHAGVTAGSETSETFKVMERKLLKLIMNPALIATWLFGILLVTVQWDTIWTQGWWHIKLTFVLIMTGLHGWFAKMRKDFEADRNVRDHKFFRWANEAPTVAMIVIVFMAILKPFA